jgi:hypothetical protein
LFQSTATLNAASFTLRSITSDSTSSSGNVLWERHLNSITNEESKFTSASTPSLTFLTNHSKFTPSLNNLKKTMTFSGVKSPVGIFYLSNPTAPLFNVNFLKNTTKSTLSDALKKQNTLAKTERFLYNYTLLHRHSIKYGATLANVKRLFSLGFYDSQLTSKSV